MSGGVDASALQVERVSDVRMALLRMMRHERAPLRVEREGTTLLVLWNPSAGLVLQREQGGVVLNDGLRLLPTDRAARAICAFLQGDPRWERALPWWPAASLRNPKRIAQLWRRWGWAIGFACIVAMALWAGHIGEAGYVDPETPGAAPLLLFFWFTCVLNGTAWLAFVSVEEAYEYELNLDDATGYRWRTRMGGFGLLLLSLIPLAQAIYAIVN